MHPFLYKYGVPMILASSVAIGLVAYWGITSFAGGSPTAESPTTTFPSERKQSSDPFAPSKKKGFREPFQNTAPRR